MDAFFPAVEERENPQFRGMPIVVGADPKKGKGRGVVSSASYKARRFGVKSGMPISRAYQLCPDAIFLPVNMRLYQEVSEKIMRLIKKYSPKWEMAGLDEAYLDLSHLIFCPPNQRSLILATRKLLKEGYKKAEALAEKLKKEIFKKEKITATCGIGPNKLIAKMASEKAKPNGLLIIKPNQVKNFLEPLDIQNLPGIGPKTAERLRKLGINTIKELKKLSKPELQNLFGKVGENIYEKVRGIDKEEVSSEEIIKSIGKEHTFERDTRDSEIIFGTFENIIEDVYQELLNNKFFFKTITVICRYQGFETHTKSKTLDKPTQDSEILKKESKKLLLKFLIEKPKLIRLIGLRISSLQNIRAKEP